MNTAITLSYGCNSDATDRVCTGGVMIRYTEDGEHYHTREDEADECRECEADLPRCECCNAVVDTAEMIVCVRCEENAIAYEAAVERQRIAHAVAPRPMSV